MRLIIAFFLITTSAHAASTLKVDVIHTEVGVLDYTDRPTLCVTTAREVSTGKLLGIVEDITDCFWTRQARRTHATTLELPRHAFTPVEAGEMLQHLQGFDSQLEFLWSNAD